MVFPGGDKVFLKFGDRRRMASELKIGDVVERHLEGEGDGAACADVEEGKGGVKV